MFGLHHKRGCGSREHQGGMHAMWGRHGRHAWAEAGAEGGGRRRRMFDGGELRLVLLKLIAEQERHGYDLIRAIEERTGGAYAPSPGVVYPTLTLLDDMGLIEAQQAEGSKKLFGITEAGTTHLAERAEEVAAIFARLDAVGAERNRGDARPVRRAMGNLRQVLQDRIMGQELSPDQLHAIADAIDEAARKVERL
jgi:DNA-binding PadR family transcriptional regulator